MKKIGLNFAMCEQSLKGCPCVFMGNLFHTQEGGGVTKAMNSKSQKRNSVSGDVWNSISLIL